MGWLDWIGRELERMEKMVIMGCFYLLFPLATKRGLFEMAVE